MPVAKTHLTLNTAFDSWLIYRRSKTTRSSKFAESVDCGQYIGSIVWKTKTSSPHITGYSAVRRYMSDVHIDQQTEKTAVEDQ